MTSTATLMSEVLAKAMAHPLRVNAFSVLLEGEATTNEIAAVLGEDPRNLRYHVNILEKLGCIETVRIDQAAGGRVCEKTYKASDRAYFDAEAWERLDREGKNKIAVSLMRVINEDVNRAMAGGTFFDPDDNHISRSPMTVDESGWKEITNYLNEMLLGLFDMQDRIAERCEKTEANTFPIKVEIIQFRSPPKPRATGQDSASLEDA